MSAPYVVGDSSPFLKRVLIPFWVIRIIIMVVHLAVYALAVAGLGIYKDDLERLADEYNTSLNYNAILAVSCVIMVIILLCLILDVVCIIKRARRTLSPPFFLGVNITQTVFYLVNLILTAIGASNGLALILAIIMLLSFLGLLIYASVIYHRHRTGSLRGGTYVQAHNPEVHNLVAGSAAANVGSSPSYYPPSPYAMDKTTATTAYAGQGYAAPQAYEPYAHQRTVGDLEHGQGLGQGQMGYEMQLRAGV